MNTQTQTPDLITAARAALAQLKHIQSVTSDEPMPMPWPEIDNLELALNAHAKPERTDREKQIEIDGLPVIVHLEDDDEGQHLVIDCTRASDKPTGEHSKGFTGPRIWLQRTQDKKAWRIYVHPAEGDASHTIDIDDATQTPTTDLYEGVSS